MKTHTLLLAEGHPPTLEHLTGLLQQAGYAVRGVQDAGRALEHFAADTPDAVVVAVDLPRLDGQHLANLLRQSVRGARVPVLAVDKGHLGKAKGVASVLDLRVNAYVADPLKPGELLPRLEQLLRAAQEAEPPRGLTQTLSRPPTASGELRSLPLPALLHSAWRLERDGVLVAAHRELTRRVYLLGGVPVAYDSTARQDALPAWLVERGRATPAQAERLVEALGSGLRIGAALSDAGVEAEGEELLQLLRDYTRERVVQVVGMRQGRYAFFAGREFESEVARVEVPALGAVLEGARRAFTLKAMATPLRPHLEAFPARTQDFARHLPALALSRDDLKVAMQLNGRIALRQLLAHGRGDLRATTALLWFLHLVGAAEFHKAPVAGEAFAAALPESMAPRKKKPLPPETAASLREDALRILTSSYFRSLGLDIAADTEAVERAYHEQATRFHPDTWAEYDLTDLEDLLESVQERLGASYRVLSAEDKRKGYLQYLLGRLDVGRATQVNVEAEMALRRGEALLKKRDWKGARLAFEQAVALHPREPEYYSYLAWATYQTDPGTKQDRARAGLKVLKRALALNPYLERAQVISAILENELKERTSARKRLLKVLEQNPNSGLARAALRKVGRA